ncbi:MAG: thioredoxin domain-containing protein [Polyangiaceae bacterium]|nr:thioredoxin domain-containing protein [Polyangiaceae bacterium]
MHIFGGSKGRDGSLPGQGGKGVLPSVTERDFEQQVLLSEIPVLVEFMTERSQSCQAIAPDVEAFAKEMEGKLRVVKVDIEKSPMLARQLRLQQVPTFMLFVDQRLGDAQVGPLNKKQLLAMVEPFLPRQEGALKAIEVDVLIRRGAVVAVDMRDASAYGRAHLPGAKNIPENEIASRLAELFMFQGQPVLYDRSGDKTKKIAAAMAEQGTPIAFLEGGILAWEAEGLPIERS